MISMVISRKESKRGDLLAIRVHFGSLQRFREPKTAAVEVVISQSAETRAPATTSAAAAAAARPNMQIVAVDAAAAN